MTIVFPFVRGVYAFTSPFGPRWGRNHNGVDYGVATGTVFHAPIRGRIVVPAFEPGGAGINIWVVGNNGDIWKCFHLSKITVVPGNTVDAGDPIAQTGNTGASTGPHAHIEFWPGGRQPVDPLPLLTEAETAGNFPGTAPAPAPDPEPAPPAPKDDEMILELVKFPDKPDLWMHGYDRDGEFFWHVPGPGDVDPSLKLKTRFLSTGDDDLDARFARITGI